jgi:phosphoribosylaminoimidazole (AIR) synthetase
MLAAVPEEDMINNLNMGVGMMHGYRLPKKNPP